MTDPRTSLALRELRQHLSAPYVLAVQGGVAVVLGLSGPFGTLDSLSAAARFPYWAGVVFGTYAIGAALTLLVIDPLDKGSRLLLPLRVFRGGLLVGLAVVLFLAFWNLPFFGWQGLNAQVRGVGLLGAFVVSWVVLGLRSLHLLAGSARASSASAPPPLLQRLPLEKRGALISLSATDHYVEVTTDKGRELVLMRLADAIAETGPARGMQVHRSHWVALDRVRAVQRRGDGAVLELDTGNGGGASGPGGVLVIPVSRRHMGAIRAEGLLPEKPG